MKSAWPVRFVKTNMTKNTKTPYTGSADYVRGVHSFIRFRAECSADAEAIRSLLWPWILGYEYAAEMIVDGNVFTGAAEVEVMASLRPDAPNVPQLRYLLDSLHNAHLAAETLELAHVYGEQREPRAAWTGDVKRPSQEDLNIAANAVTSRMRILEVELERMQRAGRTLRSIHDLQENGSPPVKEVVSTCWVCEIPRPGTSLKRVVRVTPLNAADAYFPVEAKKQIDMRLSVIKS